MTMQKLTAKQQEVVDLIKDGWELGSYVGPGGHSVLQKPGIGKGGEVKSVLTTTVSKLLYLGVIERAEYKWPCQHYALAGTRPVTPDVLVKQADYGDSYAHPSYGCISFSRVSGSDTVLFGSSIRHSQHIRVTISHAERQHTSSGEDRPFSTTYIVEAQMSQAQFADAITGFGQGQEVPITLYFTEKDGLIERPAFINKRDQFEVEFMKRAEDILARMDETMSKAKDKNAPQWLVKEIDIFSGWLKRNLPYLAEQFGEQMDRTVTEAKAEVEAFVDGMVRQHGIEAIRQIAPQITDGTTTDDVPTEDGQEDASEAP